MKIRIWFRLAVYLSFFGILICGFSCKTIRKEYASDQFVVVEVSADDTFEALAEYHLKDKKKAWLIKEFNGTNSIHPGKNIVIPLRYFNIGGFKPDGYQTVPVLNYTGLTNTDSKANPTIPVSLFKEQMQFLKTNDYRIISAIDLIRFINFEIQIPEKAVVLTFTDKTKEFVEIAFPVLKEFGYVSTLFIAPEHIGRTKDATWEQINNVSKNGVDIQLLIDDTTLMPENFKGTMKQYFIENEKKIRKGKELIDAKTETECVLFAYQNQNPDNILVNLLIKNDFIGAFTDDGNVNPFFVDPFKISRVIMSKNIDTEQLKTIAQTYNKLELN